MKTLIIYTSICHGNTRKVAKAMGEEIKADLVETKNFNVKELKDYDLVGFGSGIFYAKHHKSILNLAEKIPEGKNKKVFIFSTSGLTSSRSVKRFHKPLREKLTEKGYNIIGEFNSPGLDTWGPFKAIGGIKKGHPNKKDLENAKKFVKSIISIK